MIKSEKNKKRYEKNNESEAEQNFVIRNDENTISCK